MTRKKTTASSDGGTLMKAKVVVEDEEEAGLEDEEEVTVTLSVTRWSATSAAYASSPKFSWQVRLPCMYIYSTY
jgi:hypothetical protein